MNPQTVQKSIRGRLNPFRKRQRSQSPQVNRVSGTFIEMTEIVKTFHTAAGEFPALRGIDACFDRGEFVSVVGKSGSGKSTLVNMLTGIDHPTSGSVRIGDTYVHELNESEMARWRGRNLGIVFQFYQLLPMLSLVENVMLPMDLCDLLPPAERPKRAIELLDQLGLADLADKMPAAVSGGQQQSAAIARALANDPPLIIADEPTGNLDSKAADRVFQTFEALARQGKTIIVVTHDPDLAKRAFRTMLLVDGESVHETVASALPLLTHQQMLKATKSLHPSRAEPGQTILRQGQRNDSFFMIAKGQTQVEVQGADGRPVHVTELGPGQYFGEVSLLKQGRTTATIRAAAHSAVELLILERGAFHEIMNEAQAMKDAMTSLVQERIAQTRALAEALGTRGGRHAQTSLA
jgi:ABC-type lipoprotein export system ATPase subunit